MGICAGLFGLFLADKTVKDVQGIEQEMGVYLPLELQISVLRHIAFSLSVCISILAVIA